MAIKKVRIRPEGENNYADIVHPETSADIVKFSDGSTVEAHKAENVSQGNPHGIDAKANKVQPSWITPTLLNGWTGVIAYYKDEFGVVHIKGYASAGTINTNVFILPTGNRPPEQRAFNGTTSGLTVNSSSKITVDRTGEVIIVSSPTGSAFLDVVSFRV